MAPNYDRLFMLVAMVPVVVLVAIVFGAIFTVFHLFKRSDARRNNQIRSGFEVKLTSGESPEM